MCTAHSSEVKGYHFYLGCALVCGNVSASTLCRTCTVWWWFPAGQSGSVQTCSQQARPGGPGPGRKRTPAPAAIGPVSLPDEPTGPGTGWLVLRAGGAGRMSAEALTCGWGGILSPCGSCTPGETQNHHHSSCLCRTPDVIIQNHHHSSCLCMTPNVIQNHHHSSCLCRTPDVIIQNHHHSSCLCRTPDVIK